MRHRIAGGLWTGLGNPDKEILGNSGSLSPLVKEMLSEAVDLYFKKWGGCDYDMGENEIRFGIEPAYQLEDLKIIAIRRDKENCYLRAGRAFGIYGSGIRSTYRFYSDYKKRGKFKKFVDRWHGRLFK